jgi:hypothetical protein
LRGVRGHPGICSGAVASHQPASSQQIVGRLFYFVVTGPLDAGAGDENGVPASFHPGLADSLSQPAFNLVPNHGIPNSLARNEPETASVKPVGEEPDNQVTIR